MNKLVQAIESIRSKCEGLRRLGLKEMPTRTKVINPLLGALGWDVLDQEEVEEEYSTVDGKSVDYALKINRKPVLLVEAKPLDDPLDDVKSTAQVVSYAANAGIVWCVLTSGLKWKVYRSVEQCAAPDKLMFEVSLDSRDSSNQSVQQIAQLMWRFSREEMEKGTLDALGEQAFTDGKVRRALDAILRDPPRPFLNIVRKATGDRKLKPQRIKESLGRICGETAKAPGEIRPPTTRPLESLSHESARRRSVRPAAVSRRGRRTTGAYNESLHTSGKPKEVLEIYSAIDRFCLSLSAEGIERRCLAKYITYVYDQCSFCSLHIQRGQLRVWLRLKYAHIEKPPTFSRDMAGIGHWGVGDFELDISSLSELEEATRYIRMSFDASTH